MLQRWSLTPRLLRAAALALLVANGSMAAELEPVVLAEGLELRQLSPGAWVVTSSEPWSANALLVHAADGTAVLIDSPPTSRLTRELLQWADETLRPTRWVALNSHYHVDATGGNAALVERGARIWAHDKTRALLAARGEQMLEQMRESVAGTENEGMFDGERVVAPTDTFGDSGQVLSFGGEEMHLLFPGASHSTDLTVAYFPDRELLFGGCMIKVGSSAGYLGDADLASWPAAVERLRAFDARWVVPGHGLRFDAGLLDNTLAVLAPLLAGAKTP